MDFRQTEFVLNDHDVSDQFSSLNSVIFSVRSHILNKCSYTDWSDFYHFCIVCTFFITNYITGKQQDFIFHFITIYTDMHCD